MLLACIFGYADCNSFLRFGLFICAITANIVNLALTILTHSTNRAIFVLITLACTSFVGPILSCWVAMKVDNRRLWFACVSSAAILGGVCVDLVEFYSGQLDTPPTTDDGYRHSTPYFFLVLCIPFGALIHWALKVPYTTMLMTVNNQRVSEALFRFGMGLEQGDSKMRGDILTLFLILCSFTAGALMSGFWTIQLVYFSAAPPIVMLLIANVLVARSDPEWLAWYTAKYSCWSTSDEAPVTVEEEAGTAASQQDMSETGSSHRLTTSFRQSTGVGRGRATTLGGRVSRVTISVGAGYEQLVDDFDIFPRQRDSDDDSDDSDDDDDDDDDDENDGAEDSRRTGGNVTEKYIYNDDNNSVHAGTDSGRSTSPSRGVAAKKSYDE
jgi:uncharacterized membrane protein YoaK (UPF0700 family)